MIKTTKEIMAVQMGLKMGKAKSYDLDRFWVDRDKLIDYLEDNFVSVVDNAKGKFVSFDYDKLLEVLKNDR
jgi:hypothetical protein